MTSIRPLLLICTTICLTGFLGVSEVSAQAEGAVVEQAVIPGLTGASPAAQADIDRINYGAKTDFVPLVGIPFVSSDVNPDLSSYVNNLYRAAITIAALLAVIRIIFAGFQYMLSDIVTQKTEARKSIKNALLGLLIVIGAVLILETINPNLIRITALSNLKGMVGELGGVEVLVTGNSGGGGSAAPGNRLDLSTATKAEENDFIDNCKSLGDEGSQKFKVGVVVEEGKKFAICEPDREEITSSDPAEIEEFKSYCHEQRMPYIETSNSSGSTITCDENNFCQNGIDTDSNRCVADLPKDGTGDISYSCRNANGSIDDGCVDFCFAEGGRLDNGDCLNAKTEYTPPKNQPSTLNFQGRVIDTSITYTIKDPPDSLGRFDAGPYHNLQGVIIGSNDDVSVIVDIGETEVRVPCSFLEPSICD